MGSDADHPTYAQRTVRANDDKPCAAKLLRRYRVKNTGNADEMFMGLSALLPNNGNVLSGKHKRHPHDSMTNCFARCARASFGGGAGAPCPLPTTDGSESVENLGGGASRHSVLPTRARYQQPESSHTNISPLPHL